LSGDIFDIVDDKIREHLKNGKKAILGYQSIELNKNTVCEICKKELKKGEKVNIAFFENSSNKIVVCDQCKK
jgi:RNase P subunit RPR2